MCDPVIVICFTKDCKIVVLYHLLITWRTISIIYYSVFRKPGEQSHFLVYFCIY